MAVNALPGFDSLVSYGNVLAHYTTAEAFFRHIIKPEGYLGSLAVSLRLGSVLAVRDPLENRPRVKVENSPGFMEGAMQEADIGWHRTKLLCMTLDRAQPSDLALGRAYARPSLWEHYADNHAGVCLIFDKASLIDAWTIQYPDGWHGPIRYIDDMRRPKFSQMKGRFDAYLSRQYDALLYSKLTDWSNEQEYRFAVLTGSVVPQYLPFDVRGRLKAVVFGALFPFYGLREAAGICHRIGAAAYQVNWTGDEMRLDAIESA